MKVTAIIVAAGEGKRLGGAKKKPFVEIAGKPILCHTLDKFENCKLVDDIILVLAKEDLEYGASEIVDRFGFAKVRKIVAGGKERQDSVYCGLQAITDKPEIVVIHDGVRPLVKPPTIEEVIVAGQQFEAAIMAVPVKCTIKEGQNGLVTKTLHRDKLWEVQTPQAFKYEVILEAYRQALQAGYYATDDSALVERLGHKVKIVFGEWENVKITSAEDLKLVELLMRRG